MSSILVSGSIAYDVIMNFHDKFGNYILPDQTKSISVSFNIQKLSRHDGGAGHNISYNLGLLWEKSLLLGAVGNDFSASEFNEKYIDYRYTHVSPWLLTPSAHIITDDANNQITAFYPGASIESGQQSIYDVEEGVKIAIVAPNAPSTMVKHLKECAELNIPVIFDPGQPLTAFSKTELHEALTAANYLIVNEYEKTLLLKMAEIDEESLLNRVEAYIVTLGSEGSRFVSSEKSFELPAYAAANVKDPTGAGDAFRAGVLRALYHDKWWKEWMEKGSQLAWNCVQEYGTQNHTLLSEDE